MIKRVFIAVLDSMAECDQDIQRGSSTELTQLVMERQVDLKNVTVYDITVMPDGNLAAVTKGAFDKNMYVQILDETNLSTICNNTVYKSDFCCKSASIVTVGSNGVMVITINGETRVDQNKAKREITEIVRSRHVVMNGTIRTIASRCSIKKEYEFDVACAKSNHVFIMFLTTTPPQLEIENLATGLSENVQLTNFSTQFMPAFSKPYMCVDDSEGQTHVFISAMVGLGNRVVTKLNFKGEVLATLVDPDVSIPGHIAAVGDGTLLFNYGKDICLLSNKCKIVATLGSVRSELSTMCFTRTTSGLKLYCGDKKYSGYLSEYSLK